VPSAGEAAGPVRRRTRRRGDNGFGEGSAPQGHSVQNHSQRNVDHALQLHFSGMMIGPCPGTVLPATVTFTELPTTVTVKLTPPPAGDEYVAVGGNFYLINRDKRLVIDAEKLAD